jgi:flagellar hook assembly protein FlgD
MNKIVRLIEKEQKKIKGNVEYEENGEKTNKIKKKKGQIKMVHNRNKRITKKMKTYKKK